MTESLRSPLFPCTTLFRSHRARPGKPAFGERAEIPPAGRDGSRQCAGDQRIAERQDRRAERVSVPAKGPVGGDGVWRSEEHTSELQPRFDLACRPPPEKKK